MALTPAEQRELDELEAEERARGKSALSPAEQTELDSLETEFALPQKAKGESGAVGIGMSPLLRTVGTEALVSAKKFGKGAIQVGKAALLGGGAFQEQEAQERFKKEAPGVFEPFRAVSRPLAAGVEAARTEKTFPEALRETRISGEEEQLGRAITGAKEGEEGFGTTAAGISGAIGIETVAGMGVGGLPRLGRAVGRLGKKGADTALGAFAKAEQKIKNLLTPSQTAKLEGRVPGTVAELQETAAGKGAGRKILQEQINKSTDIFRNELTPAVEEIISPSTKNLSISDVAGKLDNQVDSFIKTKQDELGERFQELDSQLSELAQPPLVEELRDRVGTVLLDKRVIDEQGEALSHTLRTPVEESTFDELTKIWGKLTDEGLGEISIDDIRAIRGNVRKLSERLTKRGDVADARDFRDVQKAISGYLGEVAERAGRGDEFKQLDIDYSVFKNSLNDLKKILGAESNEAAQKILKEVQFDRESFGQIVEQSPEIKETIKGFVLKSAARSGEKGVERKLNLDTIANALNKISDNFGEKIFGAENSQIVKRWLETGQAADVFKEIKPREFNSFFDLIQAAASRPLARALTGTGLTGGAIRTGKEVIPFTVLPTARQLPPSLRQEEEQRLR